MTVLRNPSWRPELVVDQGARRLVDQSDSITVGIGGPFGRERVVYALPLEEAPHVTVADKLVRDASLGFLADPAGNLVGCEGLWICRMLTARWVEDTRRLAG